MADRHIPQQRGGLGAAVRDSHPKFIVLEGLSAVGKSTVAPLLAERLGASLVETLLPSFDDVRVQVDRSRLVMARLHFWMMCNYAVSDIVREHLSHGRDVVVESYFYRTLATHAAMGATHLPTVDWGRAVRPDLTVLLTTHAAMGATHLPTVDWGRAVRPDLTMLLTMDEAQRQQRLRERELSGGLSYWSRLEESNVEVTRRAYESFGLTALDTTDLDEALVADRLTELAQSTEVRHD